MLQKTVVAVLGLLMLSGCTDSVRDYFQKSANNKIIDTKGFAGGKRPPLYNKKYISVAKRNVLEENFDDEEDDLLSEDETETINPTLRNRQMYLKMVKKDADRIKSRKLNNDGEYTSLSSASDKVNKKNSDGASAKLQKELEQIKAMLYETKKNLEKYSCPGRSNDNIDHTDNYKNNTPKSSSTRHVTGKSEMKSKFLTEDYDDVRVNEVNKKGGSSTSNGKISNITVSEQEESDLPPHEI